MTPDIKLQNFYVHHYIFNVDFLKQTYHIQNLTEFFNDSGYCHSVIVYIMQKLCCIWHNHYYILLCRHGLHGYRE